MSSTCPALTASRPRAPHVLSITSTVVSGYSGNTLITPTLQLLAHTVSPLATATFSNPPHHPRRTGEFTPPKALRDLWDGLRANALHADIALVLSGYVPGAEEMAAIAAMVADLRRARKDVFWMLRAVLGGEGRLRVGEGAVDGVRAVLGDVDALVVNAFEAELLAGVPLEDEAGLRECLAVLHREYGVPHVVVTSVRLPDAELCVAGSSKGPRGEKAFVVAAERLQGEFVGAGDLFAALLLHHLQRELGGEEEMPLARAAARSVGKVQAVLRGCAAEGGGEVNPLGCVGAIVGEGEVAPFREL